MRRAPAKIIVTLGVATFVAIGSLAMLSVSFATNYWTEITVDRDAIDALGFFDGATQYDDHNLFNRDRGLFRTCYEPAEDAKFLDIWSDVVDGNCQLEQGYELENRAETDDWGDDYESRIHLLRCHWMFFLIAILFVITACILGLVGCWSIRVRLYVSAGICICAAGLFTLGGMVIFHVYYDLENDDITLEDAGFPAYWKTAPDTEVYLMTIRKNTDMEYGYSYYLGWGSMASCFVAALIFWAASYALLNAKRKEKMPLMEFIQPPALAPREPVYPRPTPIPTPLPSIMPPANGNMVPVVPVGPPVVPVVPITELYGYAASRAPSQAPSHYTYPALTRY